MNRSPITVLIASLMLANGCSQEPPPRSVLEFIDDPLLLEAALVRCTQDRSATRYEAECINAREAVNQIEAREAALRRAELEAASKRKRDALRRTQAAAAAARRRVLEAEKRRQEAEYLAQFETVPGARERFGEPAATEAMTAMEESAEQPHADERVEVSVDEPQAPDREATDGGNAPDAGTTGESDPDLSSVREELRRRNEES